MLYSAFILVEADIVQVVINMMRSVKGGLGQTFALARHNESEGRKTRIRRSKEERKAMVDSFIKKYQKSNNGNFPSLNLTHKEVGGSFYTVREIVRDIIQENRVLGPAKFTLEELNTDQFFEQNPVGSIAKDPQPFLASLNESHPEPNKLQDTNSNMISVSDGSYAEVGHHVDDKGHVINVGQVDVANKEPIGAPVVSDGYDTGTEYPMVDTGHAINVSHLDLITKNESVEATIVCDGGFTKAEHKIVDEGCVLDGSQVDMINKEPSKATIPEIQVSDPTTIRPDVTPTPMAKVTAVTEDLIIETFPLRPLSKTTDGKEGLGELRDISNSAENFVKRLELEQSKEKSELNGTKPTNNSNSSDEKFEDAPANQILMNFSNTGHNNKENVGDILEESAYHSTHKEHFDHEFEDHTDPQVVSRQNTTTLENINQSQLIDGAQTSARTKNLNKTYKPSDEEGPRKADKHRGDVQLGGNSQRRSNTTVDRINLESWDGRAKNFAKEEPNPLLAVLKAFVNAFVKIWSG
ncbi:hypothetical protein RJT34_24566 [Clitoria ternatea]|uniref:AT3G52170-like helix-turn-helix domain-containing protein n=1 Tax=Clitoria ternatea TaxID=43366 RepID=A0AAN9FWK6_CLITE